MAAIALDYLNALAPDGFTAAVGDICENAPWIAASAAAARPFATVGGLHAAMMEAARTAPLDVRLAFLRGHPELAGKVARAGAMTADSVAEQGGLGLDRLSDAEFSRFEALNTAYRSRFGFPFIICVRRHTRDSILAQFARRLENDADAEMAAALHEIGFISRLRLAAKVSGPGMPVTSGELAAHVQDTVRGRPAAGVAVSLHEIGAEGTAAIAAAVTNAAGGTDTPLVSGEPLRIGTYELRFQIGAYFLAHGPAGADPLFPDPVTVRFSIAAPEARYHMSLLASPAAYTVTSGRL